MIETLFPEKVVKQNNCCVNDQFFVKAKPQIKLTDTPLLTIGKGGFIVLDFGQEMCGCVHILFTFDNTKDLFVRLRLGESVAETYAEKGENNADNHHSVRDCVLPVVLAGDVSGSESGFRFARIDNISSSEVKISKIFV